MMPHRGVALTANCERFRLSGAQPEREESPPPRSNALTLHAPRLPMLKRIIDFSLKNKFIVLLGDDCRWCSAAFMP